MFSKAKWIVFDQTESQLKHLNISFDCEFLLANWDDGVVRLHELYRISPEYPLLVKEFGDSTFGTTSWPKAGLYRRRRSLDGHVLKAAIQDDVIAIRFKFFEMVVRRTNVYIKKPDKYLLPWSNTLAPFGPRLWICVITTMLLLTIFLSTTCAVINGLKIHDEEEFRLQNSWLYVFGIFCQQGHDVTPRSISGRIVYFTSYLCAVVLLAGYAGNYISFLSAGRPLNATDPLFKEVYEKLIDTDDLPADYDVGFQRVCESKYAFMTSDALMKKYAAQGSCEVIDIPQASIPGVTAMAVAKKSPYLGLINFK
ncbi:hypothetical protein C0J52_17425 [Blattella germanica]|nr:hypothetical protein C0J52_17425 [Blattella germanica]